MDPKTLENLQAEYDELNEKLATSQQNAGIKQMARRQMELAAILEKARDLEHAQTELQNSRKLLEQDEDEELKKMAREEIERLENEIPKFESDLKKLLIPKDPRDDGDAILEIRAGTGGDEASLFAAELMRMYTRYAENKGWKAEMDSISRNEIGGVKEAVIEIKGDGAYGQLKYEGGVHRVQRVPETEKSGRVHTSTASVAVLPLTEEEEFKIDPKDIHFETTTASGHGGQSVNTTYSAVRFVHLPTGITAQSQDERSQHQNKEKAMRVLRARVQAHYREERDKKERDERRGQIKGAERSDKIRTYNFPQDRITDHRLNENFHQIPIRLDGQIDDIIADLKNLEEAEKLQELDSQNQ